VFLSSDNGNSWSAVNNGLTNTITFSLAVSGSDIFTTTFGGVYLTSDKGNNWSVANSGLPYVQNQIDPLAVSNSNIFAGTFGKGVYMSSDNGSNWTAVNSGLLEDMRVSTLVINGNTLFAGTADGVGPYFSKDNGSSWKPIPLIPATTHYCFAFDPATVYLGTDNGVYKCALGANLGMGEMQINENNVALYPNPNNGQFAIEFRSSSREEIAMKVVNANGSVVYCLDKLAVNGNLTREFDLRNLAQGTYLLAFENNRMQITRQLVIAK
jgi:ligand-binding sensor domain-containing protein